MDSAQLITTPVTTLLRIKHPIFLAGMGVGSSPRLVAAVSNAGGLGVLGGGAYTPPQLREQIAEMKNYFSDSSLPFGVDLLIPKIGGGARKTNYDYTKGNLMELIDIIVDSGATLFVSAVGVPPPEVVKRLHAGGVLYMNMVGHPKHVSPALLAGADLICAQGSEAGGHTGDVPTSILIPACASVLSGQKSAFTGEKVLLVAAGGLYNGKSLAGALMLGADAVWVGTRFLLAEESGASVAHQRAIQSAKFEDIIKSTIFTGRPMHVKASEYVREWEGKRREEKLALQAKGVIPVHYDVETRHNDGEVAENEFPVIMGKVAGVLGELLPAKKIVEEMVKEAILELKRGEKMISKI